jgi:hypothetical protein
VKQWKGEITFTGKEDKNAFSALSWLAKAAPKGTNRYFITGIFNEVIDGNRVFVATDGRQMHKVRFYGNPEAFAKIPVGKNLAFKADAKQIIFTHEIDGAFPNYKGIIPDTTGITPFNLWVNKTKETGYTEALYELYSRKVHMNALHVEAMAISGCPEWKVYVCPRGIAVCEVSVLGTVYTAVSMCLRDV